MKVLVIGSTGASGKIVVKKLLAQGHEVTAFARNPASIMEMRNVFADKERGETILLASDLDYVNVRPGRLLNKPARGGVRAQLEGRGLHFEMTREDLADFMIGQLTSSEWIRKSPLVGY
jgi:uncharacterized protein YbjT (DUF2867 family)